MKPYVSICIPVFKTEELLEEALQSVLQNDVEHASKNVEVIIVNDGSTSTNLQGLSCKQIVKKFKKNTKIKINYIEHSQNKGLVEARRSALYQAKGEYIFFFDSDDVLTPNCIKDLMIFAQKENFDIVQGSFVTFPEENKRKIANFHGLLKDNEIFRSWLIEKKSSSYLWAKLIRREILLEAFNCIPPVFCNVGEDFLIWFFVTRFARTYYGIENIVYKYRQTSGMTSNKKIDNEEQIKMIASTASVFTIIYTWINEQKAEEKLPLQQDELQAIYEHSYKMLSNNLIQIENTVIPELKERAHQIMCEYWGTDFVNKIEKLRKNSL